MTALLLWHERAGLVVGRLQYTDVRDIDLTAAVQVEPRVVAGSADAVGHGVFVVVRLKHADVRNVGLPGIVEVRWVGVPRLVISNRRGGTGLSAVGGITLVYTISITDAVAAGDHVGLCPVVPPVII